MSEFCRDDCIIFPGLDAVNTLNDEPIDVNHSPLESFEIILRWFKRKQRLGAAQ